MKPCLRHRHCCLSSRHSGLSIRLSGILSYPVCLWNQGVRIIEVLLYLIFTTFSIGTTDVQDLSVDVCPEGNCASIEYVEGTISPRALVCVIGVLSDNSLDLESIRLLPIRRNMSDHFIIPVAVSGNYSVIAFDLENNNLSVPRIPMSVAADDETMFLSNGESTSVSILYMYLLL